MNSDHVTFYWTLCSISCCKIPNTSILCSITILYTTVGNEARHLTLIDANTANADAAAAAEPDLEVYNYTTTYIDGTAVSFVECEGLAPVIPDGESTLVYLCTCTYQLACLSLYPSPYGSLGCN